ncbi:hypothetical protein N7507_009061 [Penicillium longicatenatum]|nr:hypothetical protein N7507_009061 [Penicillium longicatenatum]
MVTAKVHVEPLTILGPRDIMIKIHAASLNYRNTALLRGKSRATTKGNGVSLSNGAEEVVAVGSPYTPEYRSSSVNFAVDRPLAEYAIYNEDALVRISGYMSHVEASPNPCAAVTPWTALNKFDLPKLGQNDQEIFALTSRNGVDKVLDIAGWKTIVKSTAPTKITVAIVLKLFASGIGSDIPLIDTLVRLFIVNESAVGPQLEFGAFLQAMERH